MSHRFQLGMPIPIHARVTVTTENLIRFGQKFEPTAARDLR
jgi:hypothetical protein